MRKRHTLRSSTMKLHQDSESRQSQTVRLAPITQSHNTSMSTDEAYIKVKGRSLARSTHRPPRRPVDGQTDRPGADSDERPPRRAAPRR